jgi:hypothetical protein
VARYSRGAVSSRRTSALARGAVAFAEETDMLNAPADALIDFAEVLALAGQDAEAEPEQALAHYERKGNQSWWTTRWRLAELIASQQVAFSPAGVRGKAAIGEPSAGHVSMVDRALPGDELDGFVVKLAAKSRASTFKCSARPRRSSIAPPCRPRQIS